MLVIVLVRLARMIRIVMLRMFVGRLVTVFVGVAVLMRMTVFDVSMPVFVVMGMSVVALVFVFHRLVSLDRRIQQFQK